MAIFATVVYNGLPYTVNGKVISGYTPVSAGKEGVTMGSGSGGITMISDKNVKHHKFLSSK